MNLFTSTHVVTKSCENERLLRTYTIKQDAGLIWLYVRVMSISMIIRQD